MTGTTFEPKQLNRFKNKVTRTMVWTWNNRLAVDSWLILPYIINSSHRVLQSATLIIVCGSCCASAIILLILFCVLPLSMVASGVSHTLVPPLVASFTPLYSGACIESNNCTSAASGCICGNGSVPAPVWFINWLLIGASNQYP